MSQWLADRRRPRWRDLRAFLDALEQRGDLQRVRVELDPHLEITAFCRHGLRQRGPALLFERVRGHRMPVVGNLYGSIDRVTRALGLERAAELRQLGRLLASFATPRLPDGLNEAMAKAPQWMRLAHVKPRVAEDATCRDVVMNAAEVDLAALPLQTCWPEDAGPLLTFGIVITRSGRRQRLNAGIYRQQQIGRNRLIMRWLDQRGGAQDFREWREDFPERPFPVAVALGTDPATALAAVAPLPDTLSEFQFAGLLRGARTELAHCGVHDILAPARAEIVLEGHIRPGDTAPEGPFCDHTGYYNAVAEFPVLTVDRVSMRRDALYQTSFTGRPPDDEPSVIAAAMNEIFVPLLQAQYPEVVDFHLPPAACSYRIALVSIRKQYPGHARQIMMGLWSWLRQFTYTKAIVVTDDDIDLQDADQVLWAISTRADPARDTLIVERTPIDHLDFASPISGLGGKMGIDATSKWREETGRDWEHAARMPPELEQRVASLWEELSLDPEIDTDRPPAPAPRATMPETPGNPGD